MMLTREVLEAVTLTDFNCLQGNCRGSACGFMRHTPGGDWLCEAPTPNELAACALELMAERDRYREALERLARLGNGVQYGNSDGNMIARAALKPVQKEAAHAEAGR